MTLRARRLYLAALALLFVIGSPLLVFYTLGWRYDADLGIIVQTGSLTVGAAPGGAEILIDGQVIGTTPLKAHRLAPGTYALLLQKEGWITRQQEIDIKKGQATVLEDLILLKDDQDPTLVLEGAVTLFSSSPSYSKRVAILQEGGQYALYFQDKSTEAFLRVHGFDTAIETLEWSPDESRLLIMTRQTANEGAPDWYVLEHGIVSPLEMPAGATGSPIWDSQNASALAMQVSDSLIDIYSGERISLPKNSRALLKSGDDIFIQIDGSLSVRDSLTEDETVLQDEGLSSDVTILIRKQFVNVLDRASQKLFIFQKIGKYYILEKEAASVRIYSWLDNSTLFLANDHEIRIMTLLDDERILVRYTEPLAHPTWLPSTQHILFYYRESIYSVEANSSPIVITKLLDEPIMHLEVSEKGEYAFITNTNGIYRYRLEK